MREPEYILANGTKVVTHAELSTTSGFLINPVHLSARKPSAAGVIAGVVGGHGGDVYWVKHEDGGPVAAYCFTEFEIEGKEPLVWCKVRGEGGHEYEEATLGDFAGGDGVRFTLDHRPTCYRRGPWNLLVEVARGPSHEKWGCFDAADMPERLYHVEECARREAQAIADVLRADRSKRS